MTPLCAAIGVLVVSTVAGCTTTEGNVLRTRGGDGGAAAVDAIDFADGNAACQSDGPCTAPGAGSFTVCGRVFDLATGEPLTGRAGEVTIRVYELTQLASDDDPPMVTAAVDACGWYAADERPAPLSGNVAVTSDDTQFGGSAFEWAGTVTPVSGGLQVRQDVFALAASTVDQWAAAAGIARGTITGGVLFPIFTDRDVPGTGPLSGAPMAGVRATRNGLPIAGEDYYFGDASSATRQTIDTGLSTTGINGSGLVTGLALSTEASGEKSGCSFEDIVAMTVVRIVHVQEVRGSCP